MKNYRLEGKTAVVTGASEGIGFGIAKQLSEEGVNILLVSRNEEKILDAKREIESNSSSVVSYVCGDVKDPDLPLRVLKASEEINGCDILVNNSGGPPLGSFLEFEDEDWESAFDTNLMSVVRFTTIFAERMIKNKWGRILNVTSTLAKEPSSPMVLSATMRAGVSAFTKSISYDLAESGVTINTICPGGVLTKRLSSLVEQSAKKQNITFEQALHNSEKSIPIGRFASVEEFSEIALFLLSEQGGYLTGMSLMADGGLTKSFF